MSLATSNSANKPLPTPTTLTRPYWDAAHRGELVVQRCRRCAQYQHPPRPICSGCWSDDLDWHRCSGKGMVYSYSVAHRPTTPGFSAEAPFAVAIVELDEGVRMTTNVIGCPVAEVHIGQPVKAVFEAVTPELSLVKFRPVAMRADHPGARE